MTIEERAQVTGLSKPDRFFEFQIEFSKFRRSRICERTLESCRVSTFTGTCTIHSQSPPKENCTCSSAMKVVGYPKCTIQELEACLFNRRLADENLVFISPKVDRLAPFPHGTGCDYQFAHEALVREFNDFTKNNPSELPRNIRYHLYDFLATVLGFPKRKKFPPCLQKTIHFLAPEMVGEGEEPVYTG